MPTYEYRCRKCGHRFEEIQSMKAAPLVLCPSCKTENLVRVIGSGGGMIFKGSGFYQTDYKNTKSDSSSPGAKSPKAAEKKPKTETKPDTPKSSEKPKQ